MMPSGLLDEPIDRLKIELSLPWLYQLPVRRRQDRVEPHALQLSPELVQVARARGRGISQLPTSNQERLSVYDQLGSAPFHPELGTRGSRVRGQRLYQPGNNGGRHGATQINQSKQHRAAQGAPGSKFSAEAQQVGGSRIVDTDH